MPGKPAIDARVLGTVEAECAHCGKAGELERHALRGAAPVPPHGGEEVLVCPACRKASRLAPPENTAGLVLSFVLVVIYLFAAAGAFLVLLYLLRAGREPTRVYLGGALLVVLTVLAARLWFRMLRRHLKPRTLRFEEDAPAPP